MGVDPRRPIVGFVLVAVLCAVLMAMSVGRGFGVDLIRPGKPISTPPARTQVEPPAEAPAAQPPVSIPDELSSQPYAVVGSGSKSDTQQSDTQQTDTQQTDTTTDRAATRAERKAALEGLRDAVKAQREADREAAKAERDAARDAAKADRGATKDAAKAGRQR